MTRPIRIGVAMLGLGFLTMGLLFFQSSNQSEILIADRMSEFIDAVDRYPAQPENKLVVFDLDDTVFMSSQMVGTPTWFYNMINLMRQSGAARYEAYSVVSKIDEMVQKKINVVEVEQATLSAIRTWQKMGSTVVALTSRQKNLVDTTKIQLGEIKLEFSSPIFPCIENAWQDNKGTFRNGVLFVEEHQSKAQIFAAFYELAKKCDMDIDLIAQADDQKRYITDIANFAKKNRVDFIGIIYGKALSSRDFDLGEAKKQLLNLEAVNEFPIIPDEYRWIFTDGH